MKNMIVFAALIMVLGCAKADKDMQDTSSHYIDALVIGSAETPDPVLKRVEALEKEGRVKDVVVLESFPVQIHLKAEKEILDELNSIPRVKQNLE